MNIYIITLFPDEMSQYFLKGILGSAVEKGHVNVQFIQLRDFALDKHSKVDDYPYGGKQGMLLRADVLFRAITSIDQYEAYRLLYTCPKGPVLNQTMVDGFATSKGLIIICGYYEGVDERIFDMLPIERVSVANVVLSSGELAAMVIADSVMRLQDGVLGNPDCARQDSVISGVLEHPQYTAPREIDGGLSVPDVILSGHHKRITDWRRRISLEQTLLKKPSLLTHAKLNKEDQDLLVRSLKEDDYVV